MGIIPNYEIGEGLSRIFGINKIRSVEIKISMGEVIVAKVEHVIDDKTVQSVFDLIEGAAWKQHASD